MIQRKARIAVLLALSLVMVAIGWQAVTTNDPRATANTETAQPPIEYQLLLSQWPDRRDPTRLDGQTVDGLIFIFASPEDGAERVHFFVDDPGGQGTARWVEERAPWDFAGGNSTTANAYDTRTLSDGPHSITALVELSTGETSMVTANFTVSLAVAPTPLAGPSPPPVPPAPSTPQAIYWGVSIAGVPADMTSLSAWERDVAGKAVSILHWGHDWSRNDGYHRWSNQNVDGARGHGAIPMISWTPEGGDPARWQLRTIIGGEHDEYIRQFASDAKNWGHPFFLRIMHEMNGAWGYPWQEDGNGNQRGEFTQAWRHIVDLFRQVGVTNASFVWCPNVEYAGTTNPSYSSLYPGDEYVDWTCLDGYNWGTHRDHGWETFDRVFDHSYNELLKVAPTKPVMVGEFGAVEEGGSKQDWIADALEQIATRYTRVRAAVYFNRAFDGVDWRIETSEAAVSAWRAGISADHYAPNLFGEITGTVPVP